MIPGVVDVQPAALPGAYNATFGNGQSMLVHGPSGQGLYQQFQANNPQRGLPAGALAQNAPAPQQGTPDAPVRMGTTTVAAPQGGQQEQAPAADEGPHKVQGGSSMSLAKARELAAQHPSAEAGSTQQASAQVPPAQTQAGQPRIGDPLGYSMKAIDPATGKEVEGPAIMTADGPRVYMGARAGSPGGLTGVGKEFMKHAGEAEQVTSEARQVEQSATERGSELAKQQAEEEFAFAKEQQKQAIIQQHDQEEENRQLQDHVKDMDAKYQAARDEYRGSKVDPGHYMRGNWLAVLGTMLGAVGAGLGRHPNYAMEFVNQNIDRDIRAQEKEIEIKKNSADNALADLTRSQGSLQAGKLALRQILTEKAKDQFQTIASSYKGANIQAAAQQAAAQLAEQHAQQDLARKQGYVDKAMHDRIYYAPGTAGRSAGMLVPTQGSMGSRQEAQLKGREMALKESEQAAKAAGGGGLGTRQLGTVSAARVARGAIQELASAIGSQRDENGEYTAPDSGTILASHVPYSDTRQKMNALKNTLISEVGKAQTGGALTESEAETMRKQVDGLTTPGEYQAFLNHYDRTMAEVEKQNRLVAKTAKPSAAAAEEADMAP